MKVPPAPSHLISSLVDVDTGMNACVCFKEFLRWNLPAKILAPFLSTALLQYIPELLLRPHPHEPKTITFWDELAHFLGKISPEKLAG